MPTPRSLLAATLTALALAAGCGDDEEATTPADGPTGATGAAVGTVTAADFIAQLRPEKEETLKGIVAELPACQGVEVDESFVLLMSARASDADPQEPIGALVEQEC